MPDLPRTVCFAPFVQITTHPTGSFSPCPYLGGTSWLNHSGTILDKWTSQQMQDLRDQFLDGQKPMVCTRCWNEEAIGKRSLRQRLYDIDAGTSDYEMFQDSGMVDAVMQSIQDKSYASGPRIISIKNGNVCNARCRSCHPEDSSQWIQDANRLYERTHRKFYKLDIRESNWSDDQIDQLKSLALNLSRIELFGGESLYNKKVLRLLNDLADQDLAKHISLYVNTNGSVDILDKIPKIAQFRDIDIGVSIDAVPEQFTYVRHPLQFETVAANVRRWRDYFTTHGMKFNLQSISTVSVLNIYHLRELKSLIIDLMGRPPFWNLLVHPSHLSIVNLPYEVKQKVIERLGDDPDFAEFVNFMQSAHIDLHAFRNFFVVRDNLDDIRKEKFSEVYPEFSQLIEPHRPLDSDINIFIGDLAQELPGKYLESVARQEDDLSFMLRQSERPGLVCVREPDGCENHFPLVALPPGTYFTGVTKWQDRDLLARVLDHAREVIYVPPRFWSDGADYFTTLMPPRGWSRIVTEELLAKIKKVRIIQPS